MKKPCGPLDMISDLPSNIIENILIRLPISEVVGTSVLSRKWRYKWVTLPHLVIDSSLGKKLLERRGQSGKCELVKVVYRLLLLHKGPLVKFAIEVDELDSCPDIDNWINFLSNHDIQEFTLSRAKTDPYKLPSHLFTFQHLRHLKVSHCVLRPPDGFKGFIELISLEVEEVIMDAETLEWLVSSCPLLEQLIITSYTAYGSIEIRAPSLMVFSLTGEFASISFKNTLFLEEVSVSLCRVNKYSKHKSSNLVKFVRSLPAVKKLYLEGYFLEYLSLGAVPKKLPVHFKTLEVLRIDEMDFSNLDEVLCALRLITSSPKLEELTIVAYAGGDFAKDAVVEYFETQNLSYCSLKALRFVTMEQISNFEPEIEFIKFILANSPELEEMEVIQSTEDTKDEDELNLLRELLRFRRASPRAEVVMVE